MWTLIVPSPPTAFSIKDSGLRPKDIRKYTIDRIRQASRSYLRESCCVCGLHEEISHLHHIIPVVVMADMIMKYDLYDIEVPNIVTWFCPNHHAYYHKIERGLNPQVISILELKEMRAIAAEGEQYFNPPEVNCFRDLAFELNMDNGL